MSDKIGGPKLCQHRWRDDEGTIVLAKCVLPFGLKHTHEKDAAKALKKGTARIVRSSKRTDRIVPPTVVSTNPAVSLMARIRATP